MSQRGAKKKPGLSTGELLEHPIDLVLTGQADRGEIVGVRLHVSFCRGRESVKNVKRRLGVLSYSYAARGARGRTVLTNRLTQTGTVPGGGASGSVLLCGGGTGENPKRIRRVSSDTMGVFGCFRGGCVPLRLSIAQSGRVRKAEGCLWNIPALGDACPESGDYYREEWLQTLTCSRRHAVSVCGVGGDRRENSEV
jgi:hypothetical protein